MSILEIKYTLSRQLRQRALSRLSRLLSRAYAGALKLVLVPNTSFGLPRKQAAGEAALSSEQEFDGSHDLTLRDTPRRSQHAGMRRWQQLPVYECLPKAMERPKVLSVHSDENTLAIGSPAKMKWVRLGSKTRINCVFDVVA